MNTKMQLLPTDVLSGVLYYLHGAYKISKIPSRKRKMHTAFYEMRGKGVSILDSFKFDTRGMFPYSSTLDQATSNLASCLLLERNNPKLNIYLLTEQLNDYFENNVKSKASEEDIEQMSAIAEHIREVLQ